MLKTLDEKIVSLTPILNAKIDNTSTKIDTRLVNLQSEINTSWQAQLDSTKNAILSQISSSYHTKSDVNQHLSKLETRLKDDCLSKMSYEQSLGLLGHEKKYVYNALHRRRLCRTLSATHAIINWDKAWPTWNLLSCNDFYAYVSPKESFRAKEDW